MRSLNVASLALFIACATPGAGSRVWLPSATQADAETVLEGTIDVIIEDSDRGSRTLYFLVSGDQRVPLRFVRNPVNLATGTRVRVRGRWEKDNTLLVTDFQRLQP